GRRLLHGRAPRATMRNRPDTKRRHRLRCPLRPLPSAVHRIRRYPWPLWIRRSVLPGHDAAWLPPSRLPKRVDPRVALAGSVGEGPLGRWTRKRHASSYYRRAPGRGSAAPAPWTRGLLQVDGARRLHAQRQAALVGQYEPAGVGLAHTAEDEQAFGNMGRNLRGRHPFGFTVGDNLQPAGQFALLDLHARHVYKK